MLAPFCQLRTLPQEGLDRLWRKYGPWVDVVALAAVRNTMAPAIWNVAEPFGGMAEIMDLELARVLELAELGLYRYGSRKVEWPAFTGSDDCPKLLGEQRDVWRVLDEGAQEEGTVRFRDFGLGNDVFNNQRCVVSAGPVGDLSIVRFTSLELRGDDWCIRDGELDGVGQPLNRTMVAIVMCERGGSRYPVMMTFDPTTGALSQCGPHVQLTGDARRQLLGYLFEQTLGPHGLGWLA